MQTHQRTVNTTTYRILAAIALIIILSVGFSAATYASEQTPVIRLTGTGTLTLVPDTASISMGINVRGDDLSTLQTAANSTVSNILTKMRVLSIEDKDLAATNIRISPRYRYDKVRQQSVADGYEVSRDITVTVRDLTLLAQVMSEASDAGINNISPPQLSSSLYEESYQNALGLAVAQARERALALAEAANVSLGSVISMSTQQSAYRPQPPMMMRAMESDSPQAAYQPGELLVSATVDVVFAIFPE